MGRREGERMKAQDNQRINWLRWTVGVCGVAERMNAQDNVILMRVEDQLPAVDLWGAWIGGKDESAGQCYSYDSKASTGCGGPVGHVGQREG
ncbi:hypothetical protein E2C01_102723 [Portunus trituberculatus]|uniref:Uncharacterized protein n=1 Tax=Portunus trituberculatus TaxID=210409 RepID=A0A5B7KDC7_PORTR|nr:hypothetical protein [Portunus trituberculatus]